MQKWKDFLFIYLSVSFFYLVKNYLIFHYTTVNTIKPTNCPVWFICLFGKCIISCSQSRFSLYAEYASCHPLYVEISQIEVKNGQMRSSILSSTPDSPPPPHIINKYIHLKPVAVKLYYHIIYSCCNGN